MYGDAMLLRLEKTLSSEDLYNDEEVIHIWYFDADIITGTLREKVISYANSIHGQSTRIVPILTTQKGVQYRKNYKRKSSISAKDETLHEFFTWLSSQI